MDERSFPKPTSHKPQTIGCAGDYGKRAFPTKQGEAIDSEEGGRRKARRFGRNTHVDEEEKPEGGCGRRDRASAIGAEATSRARSGVQKVPDDVCVRRKGWSTETPKA